MNKLLILALAVGLGGCGEKPPKLTDEQCKEMDKHMYQLISDDCYQMSKKVNEDFARGCMYGAYMALTPPCYFARKIEDAQ